MLNFTQKLNDLRYILDQKRLNADERGNLEMVYAIGNVQSYIERVAPGSTKLTITMTGSARYLN